MAPTTTEYQNETVSQFDKRNYLSGSDIEYELRLSEMVSAERLVLWDRRIDRALECRPETL